MPVEAEIGSPKGLFEDTKSWVSAWNSVNHESKARYGEIYSKQKIHRPSPRTPHENIHWSFSSWNTNCQGDTDIDEFPAAFVAVVPDGKVSGADGSVITPDDYLLADVSLDLEVVWHKDTKRHSIFSQEQLPPVQYLDEVVAVLSVLGAHNYYHWMFDLLPRVELLRRGVDIDAIDRFIVPPIRSLFQKETLTALGIPESRLFESDVDTHLQARELIVPSRTGHISDMPKWTCDFLRREFLLRNKTTNRPERIYVSRADSVRRKVINEEEVVEFLRRYGFRSVKLSTMTVAEQVSLFHAAEVVVAPHGAGLTNLAFCRPGVKVIEIFSPNYVNCGYWVLCNWVAADYYYFLGEGELPPAKTDPFRFWEDIVVNLDVVSAALKISGF